MRASTACRCGRPTAPGSRSTPPATATTRSASSRRRAAPRRPSPPTPPATCSRRGRRTARRSPSPAIARDRSTCTCTRSRPGTLRRLTTDSAAEYQPAWSPDGRRILFARATAAGRTIDVMPAAGGTATALTGVRGNELPELAGGRPDRGHGRLPGAGRDGGRDERHDHRQELRRGCDGAVRLGPGDGRRGRVGHRDHRHEPGGLGHGRRRRHDVARIVGRHAGRPVHLPVGGATRSVASTWLTPAARSAACAAEPTTT